MNIFQSRSFANTVKKITAKEKATLDREIRKIVADPGMGAEKTGDLRGVMVHKFKLGGVLHLLAYRLTGDDLELIMLGPHENYYRDLKTYLKSR
ncbi:MAG TPA: type II toxin-antitoxin system RelE/ParE family toxin [Desulfurivibrionaceae bacterium]|nr:type II toxin-antitoxin system RelE/ParE family toxin [Desulfurivibrionaceae bacterium]